ncbi:MAG: B12-binding domain-containing radical SAM protein [Calditrichia bacterium]
MSEKAPHILLVNPWIYDFSAFDLWSKPLGLLYIAGLLEYLGYRISLIDCMDRNHPAVLKYQGRDVAKSKKNGSGPYVREILPTPEVLKFMPRRYSRYGMPEEIFIQELKNIPVPDVILLTSVMTYWYPGVKHAVELLREAYPGAPIVLGGIYATLLPEHARQVVKPDYLITGPGEIKTAELLQSLFPAFHPSKSLPQNLDEFPYPAWHLYSRLNYLIVMTSRGCPYHCTFCATDKISGKYAQRNPDRVLEEIVSLSKKHKVRDIAFYDDALFLNKQTRIIPLLEKLTKFGVRWRFHTPNGLHARQIDQYLAKLMYKSGFQTIRLSFESESPQRLADMKHKVTPNVLQKAVEHLVEAGYSKKQLEAYVLMGLPRQPFEEVFRSILFVNTLGIKVRLASFSPIPGTPDYHRAIGDGLFPPNADPLLMNKSVYPLFRNREAYYRFHRIRQLVNILNGGIDHGVSLLEDTDWVKALSSAIKDFV